MKTISFIILSLVWIPVLQAQNEVDALRYSQMNYMGTSRSLAMGGAFGALGADLSTLSTNPAGIGLYRKNEFSITPLVFISNTEAQYNGTYADDGKSSFSLGNVGIVMPMELNKKAKAAGWQRLHFGMGINRLNDFNNRMVINGYNPNNSMLDAYTEYAKGTTPDNLNPFDTKLAFDTWLMDTLKNSNTDYYNVIPDGDVWQRKYSTTWGSVNEFVMTLGGNYNDKLYFGATFGFPWIRYFEESEYIEVDEEDKIYDFDQMSRNEYLEVHGAGFTFKGGLIFRPTDFIRVGAAVHTPTYYSIDEEYSASMTSWFDNGDRYSAYSPILYNEYRLETPLRLMGSLAILVSDMFIMSAEYEFADYSNANLRPDNHSYQYYTENDAIRYSYQGTNTFRGGIEFRADHMFLRGGAGYSTSPYKNNVNDGEKLSFSGGIGYRDDSFFIDFAYVWSGKSEDYYMYDPALVSPSNNRTLNHMISTTLGFRM